MPLAKLDVDYGGITKALMEGLSQRDELAKQRAAQENALANRQLEARRLVPAEEEAARKRLAQDEYAKRRQEYIAGGLVKPPALPGALPMSVAADPNKTGLARRALGELADRYDWMKQQSDAAHDAQTDFVYRNAATAEEALPLLRQINQSKLAAPMGFVKDLTTERGQNLRADSAAKAAQEAANRQAAAQDASMQRLMVLMGFKREELGQKKSEKALDREAAQKRFEAGVASREDLALLNTASRENIADKNREAAALKEKGAQQAKAAQEALKIRSAVEKAKQDADLRVLGAGAKAQNEAALKAVMPRVAPGNLEKFLAGERVPEAGWWNENAPWWLGGGKTVQRPSLVTPTDLAAKKLAREARIAELRRKKGE